jgi:hypothetical protein
MTKSVSKKYDRSFWSTDYDACKLIKSKTRLRALPDYALDGDVIDTKKLDEVISENVAFAIREFWSTIDVDFFGTAVVVEPCTDYWDLLGKKNWRKLIRPAKALETTLQPKGITWLHGAETYDAAERELRRCLAILQRSRAAYLKEHPPE